MTQAVGGTGTRTPARRKQAPSNIYTVLMAIAVLILAAAVVYVWIRHNGVFGGSSPFSVEVQTSAAPIVSVYHA